MAKICKNPDCVHFGEVMAGKFCPHCGSLLEEQPSGSEGANVNLRGTAVNGGMAVDSNNVHTSDSHNVQTSDSHNIQTVDSHNQSIVNNSSTSDSHNQSIVHNTSDSNNMVNSHNVINTTSNNYHLHQKTEAELSQENLKRFRQICADHVSAKGLYSNDAAKIIKSAQIDLRIDDVTASGIMDDVKKQVKMRSEAALTTSDTFEIETVKGMIASNRPKKQFDTDLVKLEGMTERTSVEDAHFYFNFLLAALSPSQLKERFLNRLSLGIPDEYWQTFWASYSFLRDGNTKRFEEGKDLLSGWEDKPEENILLLDAVEKAVAYFKDQSRTDALDGARALVKLVIPKISGYLQGFASSLGGILEGKISVTVTRDFYTCNFFPDFRFNSYQGQSGLASSVASSPVANAPQARPAASKKKPSLGLFAGLAAALALLLFLVVKPSGKEKEVPSAPVKQEQPVEVPKATPANIDNTGSSTSATKSGDAIKPSAEKTSTPSSKPSTTTSASSASSSASSTQKSSGSYSLPYGTYNGPLASGKPSGEGKVTVSKAFALDNKSGKTYNLEPGDYLDAEFKNGQLMNAYWYGSDGKKKGSIVIAQ